jgi:acyl-CoA synthetase (AMP-forming)/AMP-acid ligase II
MLHAHSLSRAARYFGGRTALASGPARPTFRELHDPVAGIAAALSGHGFQAGDRLAICMTEGCDYTAEMEPDQTQGYCEACGGNTLVSALILAGFI